MSQSSQAAGPAPNDEFPDASSGRERLLMAASREFSEVGFASASIASIAARASVGKSTVFHHFASKDALYLAVIQQAALDFGQQLDTVLSLEQDPLKTLEDFQGRHLEHIDRNAEIARLVLRELLEPGSERAVALVRDVLAANFSRLSSFLAQAAERGMVRKDVDPASAALLMLSANVLFFQARQVLAHLPGFEIAQRPEAWTRGVADIVLNGIRQS
ncbi:MAG: TetR/AcrR family transcriptional regulator [Wenzhouxiangella sp.]